MPTPPSTEPSSRQSPISPDSDWVDHVARAIGVGLACFGLFTLAHARHLSRQASAPTASTAASTWSGVVTMLGPSRRYDVAYGVELAAMPCSRRVSTAF